MRKIYKDKRIKKRPYYYTIDIIDEKTGDRKQVKRAGFASEKEAEAAYIDEMNQVNKGLFVEPSKLTLEEYLSDIWFEGKRSKLQPVTQETYKLKIRHIVRHIGHIKLTKLDIVHIERFYNDMEDEGKLSERTILDIHKLLKNALKLAHIKYEYIPKNIASKIETPSGGESDFKVWNKEQVNLFLDSSKNDPFYVAFHIALMCGMRQAEILGLTWDFVNLDEGFISVKKTLDKKGKKLRSRTKTPTGLRKIELDKETIEVLRKHKERQERHKKKAGAGYQNNGLVVCTSHGTPVLPSNLRRSFYRIIEAKEMERIKFHECRHTHATILLLAGVHPKVVAERLGHSDVKVTLNTYSHVLPGMQTHAVEKFMAALGRAAI